MLYSLARKKYHMLLSDHVTSLLLPILSIQPRSPNIGIALRHKPPALTGEHYCIRVEITNQEQLPITNLQLVLTLPDSLDEGQPIGMPL